MSAAGIGNIGATGRRRRRHLGWIALAISVALFIVLVVSDSSRWLRLLIFPVAWTSAIALLEARRQTCVVHAAMGTCELDQRAAFESDGNAGLFNRVRARRIMQQATLIAACGVALALLWP